MKCSMCRDTGKTATPVRLPNGDITVRLDECTCTRTRIEDPGGLELVADDVSTTEPDVCRFTYGPEDVWAGALLARPNRTDTDLAAAVFYGAMPVDDSRSRPRTVAQPLARRSMRARARGAMRTMHLVVGFSGPQAAAEWYAHVYLGLDAESLLLTTRMAWIFAEARRALGVLYANDRFAITSLGLRASTYTPTKYLVQRDEPACSSRPGDASDVLRVFTRDTPGTCVDDSSANGAMAQEGVWCFFYHWRPADPLARGAAIVPLDLDDCAGARS